MFRNTGAVAVLDVQPLRALSGLLHLRDAGGTRPAAFGLLHLEHAGSTYTSPLGAGGRFYFEQLPPGRHRARVESEGAIAECAIEVPAAQAAGIHDLGIVECIAPQGEP